MFMRRRKVAGALLFVTFLLPLFLYTDRLSTFSSATSNDYGESLRKEYGKLNALPQDIAKFVEDEYPERSSPFDEIFSKENELLQGFETESAELPLSTAGEHKNRMLSTTTTTTTNGSLSTTEGEIEQVTEREITGDGSGSFESEQVNQELGSQQTTASPFLNSKESNKEFNHTMTRKDSRRHKKPQPENNASRAIPDAKVRHFRDQLIRARVYQTLGVTRNNPHFIRELRLRIKEIQHFVGDETKDSDLPRNADDKLKAMEQTLAKGKQIQEDCASIVKKLRAMLHSTEEQLRAHQKQEAFLTQLAAKTLPKGLNCLPLRLSNEYFNLVSSKNASSNQDKFDDPKLYHYALFSDNIFATAVVVNSTISNAKSPEHHVFHIVTDRLNYVAMKMWFIANPPGKAAIQVQNIEEFTWLNSSYSPVLKQLGSKSMIDYYFRTHSANSDANLKYRNPKYLSILNHLRFYLPEVFPKLNKVVFLDDDIIVQKDLSGLWNIDIKGKVNGAVENCGADFHRFHRYLNFSNPFIAKSFDPHACGWAYGMNVFDLTEWRKQNVTEVYHYWQNLNSDRQLWKLGTLPPGLITFYNRTFLLEHSWHVLGLGYNPSVSQKEIERAAVIHYNGNLKPWLEVALPKYRPYWTKYVDYDQVFLRDCNISPP